MKQEDKAAFGAAVTKLCQAFLREPGKHTIQAWWEALDDLEIDTVERAIKRATRESDTMPFVAHIRRFAANTPKRDKTPAEVNRERKEAEAEAERIWGTWDVPEPGSEF